MRLSIALLACLIIGLPLAASPAAATHSCSTAEEMILSPVGGASVIGFGVHYYHLDGSVGVTGVRSGVATVVSATSGPGYVYLDVMSGSCATTLCQSSWGGVCTFDPTFGHTFRVTCYDYECAFIVAI